MNKRLLNLRCTVFTNRLVPFIPNLSSSILNLFGKDSFISAILPVPIIPPINGGSWELISSDSYLSVLFDQNKIDFVFNMQIKPTVLQEYNARTFLDFCVKKIEKIKGILDCNFIRLAYSPQYEIADVSIPEAADQFFKNTKFHDKEMGNYSMSNTFIKDEKILDTPVELNFLANWGIAKRRLKSTALGIETVQDIITCTFDINTSSRQRISYSMEALKDFFEKVLAWDDELMKNYLGGLK